MMLQGMDSSPGLDGASVNVLNFIIFIIFNNNHDLLRMMDHDLLRQDDKAGTFIYSKKRGISKQYTQSRDGDQWS